jgi:hypothetical protein
MKKNYLFLVAILFATIIISGCKKELYGPVTKLAKSGISDDSVMVVTPFGPRLKADVHIIEPGFKLQSQGNHLLKIDRAGKIAEDFGIQAPLKYLQKNKDNSGLNRSHFTSLARPVVDTNANWDIWARGTQHQNPGSFSNFKTSWKVPSVPTNSTGNQTVFIFNGLEDTSQNFLLQPVLQWGASAAGGGKYWGVSNWLVGCSSCPVYNTTVSTVSTGTVLTGTMTMSGPDGSGLYTYTSSFGSAYSASDLPYTGQTQGFLLNNFVQALEAYGITGYADYPPDVMVKMYSIWVDGVYKVTDWSLHNQNTSYGQHVLSPSFGEVDLYFHYGNTLQTGSFTKNDCGSGTGSSVADTVVANTFGGTTVLAANTAAQSYLNGGAGQANANAKGYCSGSYTFSVVTNAASASYFDIMVNGVNISGSRSTATQYATTNVSGYCSLLSNSTVVMQITAGHIPTSATINGPFGTINAVISGSNVTFSNVNLSFGGSCSLTIN